MVARIDEVAAAAGVSVSTVSRALRGLPDVSERTRKRVQALAAELGYVASAHAAGLASGRAMALNVIVPTVTGWFTGNAIEGIDSTLRVADYDMVLFNLGTGPERDHVFQRSLLRKRGDAVLALCLDFTEDERRRLAAVALPTIVVGGPVSGIRHIGIDEVAVGRRATEHLLALGHRDILHVTGGDEIERRLNPAVPAGRAQGYRQALEAAGIAPDERRIVEGRFTTAESRNAVGEVLVSREARPTAIFAASDEMAIGAILAAYDHGVSVPGDLSVIGVDDHRLAEQFGITTFRQDPFAQGALAARLLLDEVDGIDSAEEAVITPVQFIERESTAPPRP